MPFVKMPGVTGKVYIPEPIPGQIQKHPCPDCFTCQRCSDDRCTVCRPQEPACLNRLNSRQSDSVSQCHHHRKQHQ